MWQMLASLAVAAAGLVPVVHKNKPFWGLYAGSINHGPARIHQIDDDSPAKAAGLQRQDIILAVNGVAVDNLAMSAAFAALGPGDEARLRVKRGEAELDIAVRGVEPPVALIYYPTAWHPVAGGAGLALVLLVLATQPLRPAPLWRPTIVVLVGLGCSIVFFLALIHDSPFAFLNVRQYRNLNWGDRLHFEQTWVGLVASLALALSAAVELRGLLARRSSAQNTPNCLMHSEVDSPLSRRERMS